MRGVEDGTWDGVKMKCSEVRDKGRESRYSLHGSTRTVFGFWNRNSYDGCHATSTLTDPFPRGPTPSGHPLLSHRRQVSERPRVT